MCATSLFSFPLRASGAIFFAGGNSARSFRLLRAFVVVARQVSKYLEVISPVLEDKDIVS